MSDDLISRRAAIDALGEEPEVWSENDDYALGLNNQWHYDVNALRAVSPAPSAPTWIPVTERLPEDERYVLVTTVSGDVTEAKYWQKEGLWVKELVIMSVTAWMPLPEPYKEEI